MSDDFKDALNNLKSKQQIVEKPATGNVATEKVVTEKIVVVQESKSTVDNRKLGGECEHCGSSFKLGDVKCPSCGATLPEPGVLTQRQKARRDEELREKEEAVRKKREAKALKRKKFLKVFIITAVSIVLALGLWLIIDGAVYNSREKGIVYSPYLNGYEIYRMGYNYAETNLYINEYKGKPVLRIDHNAFNGNTTLKTVTISKNVIEVGAYAFKSCVSLETVIFEEGSNPTMDVGMFQNCTKLREVKLASTMQELGSTMFANTALVFVDLPNIATIPLGIFEDCKQLQAIYIKKGCVQISSNAFRNAAVSFYFYEGSTDAWLSISKHTYSGINSSAYLKTFIAAMSPDGKLFYTEYYDTRYVAVGSTILFDLETVEIPSTINGKTVQGVNYNAFEETVLIHISLPNTVIHIYDDAFLNCYSLVSIKMGGNLTIIDSDAFLYCTSLKTIYIRGQESDDKNKTLRASINYLKSASVVYGD